MKNFKVGDFVKPIERDNFTDEINGIELALVTKTFKNKYGFQMMTIKILDHEDNSVINNLYTVLNYDSKYKEVTLEELKKLVSKYSNQIELMSNNSI